ncbi:MAG: hypothetical protein M1423_08045 [Acidobacteria bacterium]|nr:hypothetical protein [Acidobacteriota bacterium]
MKAKLGEPKTEGGKAVVKYNALKHGLLAREAVIDAGDGAESREEFTNLLTDLSRQLRPVGVLEEMLVEKIAAFYWRHRRVIRYEVGLIREGLDGCREDYEGESQRVEKEIRQLLDEIATFRDTKDVAGDNVDPEKVEEWGWEIDMAEYYHELVNSSPEIEWQDSFQGEDGIDAVKVHAWLLKNGWTHEKIKQAFIRQVRSKLRAKKKELAQAKTTDDLKLGQIVRVKALAMGEEADRLMRYESSISRQFYRAMHELERLQKGRQGLPVPPPVALDVEMERPDA